MTDDTGALRIPPEFLRGHTDARAKIRALADSLAEDVAYGLERSGEFSASFDLVPTVAGQLEDFLVARLVEFRTEFPELQTAAA
jgi:hypothetical protein